MQRVILSFVLQKILSKRNLKIYKMTFCFYRILSLDLHDNTFVVNSSLSTIYTTMNDRKTLNAVVSKMLKKTYHLSAVMYVLQTLSSLIWKPFGIKIKMWTRIY